MSSTVAPGAIAHAALVRAQRDREILAELERRRTAPRTTVRLELPFWVSPMRIGKVYIDDAKRGRIPMRAYVFTIAPSRAERKTRGKDVAVRCDELAVLGPGERGAVISKRILAAAREWMPEPPQEGVAVA